MFASGIDGRVRLQTKLVESQATIVPRKMMMIRESVFSLPVSRYVAGLLVEMIDYRGERERERDLNVWKESKLDNSSRTNSSIKHASCLDGLC
jgi:hypothetical protein